jgi:hypothetical protein
VFPRRFELGWLPFRRQSASTSVNRTPPDIANASRRLERRERTATTLVNTRDYRLSVAHQVIESQCARALDHAVDSKRPLFPFDTGNSKMTQYNDVLCGRETSRIWCGAGGSRLNGRFAGTYVVTFDTDNLDQISKRIPGEKARPKW